MKYKAIRAVYSEKTIRVYQAFSKEISEEALRKGTFGEKFNLNRMTWIKPSFLWMMYRSGWAEKENQEHILAIDMKKEAFDYLVKSSVNSIYSIDMNISKEEWKNLIASSEVRCQWDPERDVNGNALEYRSLQLGIKGSVVRQYVKDWIVEINDITEYVKMLKSRKEQGISIDLLLPQEEIYVVK